MTHSLRSSAIAVAIAVAPLTSLVGCGSDDVASPTVGQPAVTGPTFHRDIEPILQRSCQGCHSDGHIAPFSLTSYPDAKTVAALMVTRVKDRTMPPFAARETDECKPRLGWQDDIRLSDDEIAQVEAWAAAGAPEGDPAEAPAAKSIGSGELEGVDQTVEPDEPYTTSGDSDQFRCFVIDPKLTSQKFLNGMHFVAGNPKVVHHALMFLDKDGASAALADADGGYDCFGGPGVDAQLIGAWAPGSVPVEFPPDAGIPMTAGSRLVMQIHYHPAGSSGSDSTKFQMRFTDGKPDYRMNVSLIGNFDQAVDSDGIGLLPGKNDPGGSPTFVIPKDTKDHVETMQLVIPAGNLGADIDVHVYGVGTHMHYVGTDMKMDIVRAQPDAQDPAEECFIQTPQWDFNWQRWYAYDGAIDQLPRARTGDKLVFRCTYDNTMDNPFVMRALTEQHLEATQDIHLGETTLDEMCLGVFFSLEPL